jgi:hypothetical protein
MMTITLSNIPDLTASVSAPRIAAIEYPIGLPLGMPGDHDGQLAVLRSTLQALGDITVPGGIVHLRFKWPKERKINTHAPKSPPIVNYLVKRPWLYRKLLARDVPSV